MATPELPLPAQPNNDAARKAEGFATPSQDKTAQCASFLPKRVLPIIFLPGIMGSNLRVSEKRQKELHQSNNIAWRPDSLGASNAVGAANEDPAERQLKLDPLETSVDIYEPAGPSKISGDGRHGNVQLSKKFNSPLLADDPPTAKNPRTAVQKARERGWGEVFFKSYGNVLQHFESRLNNTFFDGKLRQEWNDVVGVDPAVWRADPKLPQSMLTDEELKKAVTGCWLPVYAFGYNWLQSNGDSAKIIAKRITQAMDSLTQSGYECNQVIIVTHSMGGLVGRALIHPDYGNLKDKVLGIVHGVQPAIGAPAAYKRMRAGFEDPGMLFGLTDSIGAKVTGNYGDEVTAVLANSPGGLELLPTEAYANEWLKVKHKGNTLSAWPKNGDPYEEIYKVRGKWYSLLREEWINPAGQPDDLSGWGKTCKHLNDVKFFHRAIRDTYHPYSYAHYGADSQRHSFGEVVWEIGKNCKDPKGWEDWPLITDTKQGKIELVRQESPYQNGDTGYPEGQGLPNSIYATIRPPDAPGDQTVPAASADHQLQRGIFKGVFRQNGYEHQSSYNDANAIASTLYSIVRIAQQAKWKNCS